MDCSMYCRVISAITTEAGDPIGVPEIYQTASGYLQFKVYRKNTHTDKYLDFNSIHPLTHKESVIRSLFERSYKLCDDSFLQEEHKHLNEVLQANNYPRSVINKVKNKISNRQNSTNNNGQQNSNLKYASAPYLVKTSEKVSKLLKPFNIRLAHKPSAPLRNHLCNFKDKRPISKSSGVIYKISCSMCLAVYIGETGRLVEERMAEHQRDIRNKKRESLVYMHTEQYGHTFDFTNVRILARSNDPKTRRKLEGIYTHRNPHAINRAWELNPIYSVLF